MTKTKKLRVRSEPMTTAKVAKIAKGAVKDVAVKKFFYTQQVETTPSAALNAESNYVSAIGFSTTNNQASSFGQGPTLPMSFPSGSQIEELHMLTPYTELAPDDLKRFTPTGKSVQPVSAKCRFNIQRDFSRLEAGFDPANQTFSDTLIENLWTDIRMIQVCPKIASGTSGTNLDPRLDLFVDNYGNFCGIDTTNDPTISNNEMFTYGVNKRRYEVIADKKYVMGNPLSVDWTRDDAGAGTRYQPHVRNVNKNCELNITTYHRLSQRKHGKIYYNEATDTQPTNGHRREYVFFLFKYRGGDKLIQAIGLDEVNKITPSEVIVKAIPQSKFIDV